MASHCPWVGKGKREAVPAPTGRGREEANGHTAPSTLRPACHTGRPWPEKAGLFQESGVLGARLKAFIGLTEENQMETAVPGDSLLNYLLVGSLPVN